MLGTLLEKWLICSAGVGLFLLFLLPLSSSLEKRFSPRYLKWLWVLLGLRLCIPTALQSTPLATLLTRYPWTVFLWLCGFFIILIFQFICYSLFMRSALRWSVNPEKENTQRVVSSLCAQLRIPYAPAVFVTIKVSSPMVVGFFRPKILLPHETYDGNSLYYILRHELMHFKRHDIWYKSFLLIVSALHWFNPLVWLMVWKAGNQLEVACDESAVENLSAEERASYVETLLHTVHVPSFFKTAKISFSTYFYSGTASLCQRMNLVITQPKKHNGLFLPFASLCLFLLPAYITLFGPERPISPPLPLSAVRADISTSQQPVPDAAPVPPSSPDDTILSQPSREEPPVPVEKPVLSLEALTEMFSPATSSSSFPNGAGASGDGEELTDRTGEEANADMPDESAIVKDPYGVPDKKYVLPVLQDLIRTYEAGTADTTMKDPSKPRLMPVPADLDALPSVSSADEFTLSYRSPNTYGAILFFQDGWQMHVWLYDSGPEDAYQFTVTAASFVRPQPASNGMAGQSVPAETAPTVSASEQPAASQEDAVKLPSSEQKRTWEK